MVLLDRLVTKADCALCDCVHMVRVVESVVAIVMTNRCDYDGEDIKVSEPGERSDVALHQKEGSHLQHISSMDSIVILNRWTIAFVDLVQESHQDIFIDLRKCV